MGSSHSKVETESVGESDTTFFAARQAPVQFSSSLIDHLSASDSSSSPSSSRQQTVDSHIQARIQSELVRLREEEVAVRQEIEVALEKENLDREQGAGGEEGEGGVSHSVSLMRDLEELEKRTNQAREDSRKDMSGETWSHVNAAKKSLGDCLIANQETNLDCRGFAASFFSTVSKVEETFLH